MMNLQEQVLEDKASEFDQVWVDELTKELNTVKYGYATPFFWIEMPDGKRNHMITRGKFMASLAVLRMNYPHIKLELVGQLPQPKRKNK
jgi:hypothetical protein